MFSKKLFFIDYLRALASVVVAVAHIYSEALINIYNKTNTTITKILLEFIITGGFGVCIFFLVSGFIIPLSFSNIKTFLIRRLLRIYPAFFIAVLIAWFILKQPFEYQLIYSYTLILADIVKSPTVLADVDWTLRIEIIFYLYIAILMWNNKLNFNSILITSIILLIMCFVVKKFNVNIAIQPFIYFYLFLIGMLFYLRHEQLIDKRSLQKIGVTVFIIFFSVFQIFEFSPYKHYSYPFLAIGIFYLAILYKDKFHECRIVTFFSDCSYPLYLLHNVIFRKILESFSFIENYSLRHFISWLMLLSFCYLVHILVEKPCIALGRRLS